VLDSGAKASFAGGDVGVTAASRGPLEPFGSTSPVSVSGVVSIASASTAATSTATVLLTVSLVLDKPRASSPRVFVKPRPSSMFASCRSCCWPAGGNVVTEALMSTSAGGGGAGEAGVCAWRSWAGECGGLEKDGDDGCWLKCSGCSTLTLMA
jgi:hypothetical protein